MKLSIGIRDLKNCTNINDVVVPDVLRKRIPTGLNWFDDAVGRGGDDDDKKGIIPGCVGMITGSPGAGKTTLMLQLADSLTGQGHVCLFNTGEESLYQVRMVTERLKFKHGFICGQDDSVHSLLKHADELRKKNPKKQVFVIHDSLPTLDDDKYSNGVTGKTPVSCAQILTDWAKNTYGIVFFVNQVTKDNITFVGKQTVAHMVDLRMMINFDVDKKSETFGERIFSVPKNRWGTSQISYILGMNREGLFEKSRFEPMI